jgi:hypothetical protein
LIQYPTFRIDIAIAIALMRYPVRHRTSAQSNRPIAQADS